MEKTLKKLLALLMCAGLAFGFNACDDDDDTTPLKAVVKNITAITDCSMTINAEISGDGKIEERGVIISEDSITLAKIEADVVKLIADKDAEKGFYTMKLDNLQPETKYYVCAYLKNNKGKVTISEQKVEKTSISTAVKVSDFEASDYSFKVNVTVTGNDGIVSRGVYMSDKAITDNDYDKLTPVLAKEAGVGEFETSFNNLFRDTEYHIVAFAKSNSGVITYSEDFVVKTTAKEKAYIKIDVERTKSSISAKLTSNDPLKTLALRKGGFDKDIEANTSNKKEGIYTYTVELKDMAEAAYYIVAKSEHTNAEAYAGTGRFIFDYTLDEVVIHPEDEYHFMNGDNVETVYIESIGSGQLTIWWNDDKNPSHLAAISVHKFEDGSEAFSVKYDTANKIYKFIGAKGTKFYKVSQ